MSLQHSSQRKRKWRIFLAKQKKKEIKREPSRRASRMGKQFTNRWHSPNSCGGCFAEWEAQPFAEINNKEKTKERRGWASLRYNSGTRGLGCAWFAELRAFCQCAVETFSHASAERLAYRGTVSEPLENYFSAILTVLDLGTVIFFVQSRIVCCHVGHLNMLPHDYPHGTTAPKLINQRREITIRQCLAPV